MPRDGAPRPPTFRAVLGVREFRAIWSGELLSQAGDQLARVAVAVLVFARTGSASLTALAYALTLVPALVGGLALGALGDRHPRRAVMISTDVGRAVLVGFAAIPGVPLAMLFVLVAATTLLNGPFKAAQQAVLPDVLDGAAYPVGMALRSMSVQAAQLVGFATGGIVVSVIGASWGLALDAATFLASAALIRAGLGVRAAPIASTHRSFLRSSMIGAQVIWRDRALRPLLGITCLAAFYVVPEALAAPYAREIGSGASAVGLLMAADPLGSVAGGVVWGRWVSARWQLRHLGLLGALAGVPLVCCVAAPPLAVSLVLLAVGGAVATGYHIHATSEFMRRLPAAVRAQGAGLAATILTTVQGLGLSAAGVLADALGPGEAIAVFGAAGICAAALLGLSWRRVSGVRPARNGPPTGSRPNRDVTSKA